jgi:predicted RNA polymerase sigma factor
LRLDDIGLVHFYRGECCEKLGRNADAAAAYGTFLQMWHDAPLSRHEVREARDAMKRLKIAA